MGLKLKYISGLRTIGILICILNCIFMIGCRGSSTRSDESEIYINSANTNETNANTFFEPAEHAIPDDMEPYYGCYRIAEFLPSIYWEKGTRYDRLPEQEADMMIGRIMEFREDVLVTYDSFRHFGTRDGRISFPCNYEIEKVVIESPEYQWEQTDIDSIDTTGRSGIVPYLARIKGKVEANIAGPEWSGWKQTYYLMTDGILMFSNFSSEYFYLERMEDEPELPAQKFLSEEEKGNVLQELMGTYVITEFLPTKFYPADDPNGSPYLPLEEAELMIGKEVVIEEDHFISYDNLRQPDSEFAGRDMDDFRLEQIAIMSPDYQIEEKNRSTLYGLKDDEMLREELSQDHYIEIKVFPGFQIHGFRYLPKLYLLDDGRIMMYAMGEYFLLVKG